MEVQEIIDREKWDGFLAAQKMSQFLQDWDWGEFKKALGQKIWRLGVVNNKVLVGACLIIKNPLPAGLNYLYAPRGPVFASDMNQAFPLLFEKIIAIAKQENAIYLKIEPIFNDPTFDFKKFGFKKGQTVQPPDTVILDLNKTEEQLLNEMHPKTRYNIRLAEKKGVKVFFSQDKKDIEIFYKHTQEVCRREKISCFSLNYYKTMLDVFKGQMKIIKGDYEGKTLVVNLNLYFGDMATYNHGASCSECRNVMAPHLVQWEAIREAKRSGYKYYDLRGIAPTDDPKEKWAGITRFKKGFGGSAVNYAGAYDLVFKPLLYRIYLLGKRLRG